MESIDLSSPLPSSRAALAGKPSAGSPRLPPPPPLLLAAALSRASSASATSAASAPAAAGGKNKRRRLPALARLLRRSGSAAASVAVDVCAASKELRAAAMEESYADLMDAHETMVAGLTSARRAAECALTRSAELQARARAARAPRQPTIASGTARTRARCRSCRRCQGGAAPRTALLTPLLGGGRRQA